jgi:hypothetical protein
MTRSLLQPIRSRRVIRSRNPYPSEVIDDSAMLTPGTRQTLAAIGALWVSFAVTASSSGTGRNLPGTIVGVGTRTR